MALRSAHEYLTYIRAENGKEFHCVELPGLLGNGAYGVVRKVKLVLSEHDVTPLPGTPHALKYLYACDDQQMSKLSVLPTLENENIVKYLAVGYTFIPGRLEERLQYCLIMELCDGGTLENFLDNNPPPLSSATILDFTGQMVRALSYLHSQRGQHQEPIIHGDLKPVNVMLHGKTDDRPVLKLADLDSFTQLRGEHTRRSDLSKKKGTIYYMSPEMLAWDHKKKLPVVGRSTDIWSLGCIVLSMSCVNWLDYRDGWILSGDSLSDHQFQSLLTDGGSPDIPENMEETVRSLVTSCLRWNPSSRLKASDLAQGFANKSPQDVAVSKKTRSNTRVIHILSSISTVIQPIIKVLIFNCNLATSMQKFRMWETSGAGWTFDDLNASMGGMNERFLQTLSDIEHLYRGFQISNELELGPVLRNKELNLFRQELLRHLKSNDPFRAWLLGPKVNEAHDQFLQVYGEQNPTGVILWLKDRLTKIVSPDLVENIGFAWEDFVVWEKSICIVLCQACSMELAYLWLTNLVENCETASTVFQRLKNLETSVRDMMRILETARVHAMSYFLFIKCDCHDRKNSTSILGRSCSCEMGLCDELCNRLSEDVYSQIGKGKGSTIIQQWLQGVYPHFKWSVIVGKNSRPPRGMIERLMLMTIWGSANNDSHPQKVEYDSSFVANLMWIQQMTNLKGANCKKGKIRARSFKYGEIWWRTDDVDCLVFWTEAKNFEEGRNFPTRELRNFIARGGSKSPDFERWAKLNLLYYRERLCQEDREDNISLAKVNGITYPLTLQDHPNIYFWPVPSEYAGEVYN
ncbi:hypothetical protein BV898_19351 [Hypsibius exemplaris]|uniref:non-specific serine/threonine protein kinase n=1 Tax=Hypsibius exemplaris TaxID=2072580 RepID=A0A9X6RNV0_HYPEX|nr:hypothetical protein BV898_19351 [Hypsibius exemplaris]